ncbi:hypothetical protein IIB50_02850 [Patescibacteria group bacterium]|nr:hypothetical protein [Patescibacteria group bacterium]
MEELIFGGKKFVSARRASRITGYTKDYIGQLSRADKIEARLVGRNWYIEEESLLTHRKQTKGGLESIQRINEVNNEVKDKTLLNKPKKSVIQPFEMIYHGSEDDKPLNPEPKKPELQHNDQKNIDNYEQESQISIKKEYSEQTKQVSLPPQHIKMGTPKSDIEPNTADDYAQIQGGFAKSFAGVMLILLGILTVVGTFTIEQVLFYDAVLYSGETSISYRSQVVNVLGWFR